jgi:hypothetical protein
VSSSRGIFAAVALLAFAAAVAAGPMATGAGLVAAMDAPAAAGRYSAHGAVVHDRETGLVWQRCAHGQRWTEELACVGMPEHLHFDEALRLQRDGWRLPSLAELRRLIDPALNSMVDPVAFPDSPPTWFWAVGPDGGPSAWGLSCEQGGNDICDRGPGRAVRWVRLGLPAATSVRP